jgi:hypothetical protein
MVGLQTEGKLRLGKLYFLQAVRRGFDGAHLLERNADLEGIVRETGSVGTGFAGKIVGDRRVFRKTRRATRDRETGTAGVEGSERVAT